MKIVEAIVKGQSCIMAVACLLAAASLHGSTYYWIKGERGAFLWGDATDTNNWSLAFDTTAMVPKTEPHPTKPPTTSDVICGHRDLLFDLKGQTIGANNIIDAGKNPYFGIEFWGNPTNCLHVTNGTLNVKIVSLRSAATDHSGLQVWNGATVNVSDSLSPGPSMIAKAPILVHDGGVLTANKIQFFAARCNVEPRGKMTIRGPFVISEYAYHLCQSICTNWGSVSFPNGYALTGALRSAYIGKYGPGVVYYNQMPGSRTVLGGNVTDDGGLKTYGFYIHGGTLEATADVLFTSSHASVTADCVVTGEVSAAAARLDLGDMTFGKNVTMVKRGVGSLALGTGGQPARLAVDEGTLLFNRENYAVTNELTFAAGTKICFAATGTTLGAITLPAEGVTCEVDEGGMRYDDVIFRSDNEATVTALTERLNATLIAGNRPARAVRDGNEVLYKAYAVHVFDATSGKTLDDATGWGESKAPVGQDVDIVGAGTVEIYPETPGFASIRVREGATLLVKGGTSAANVIVPSVTLVGNAGLVFEKGCYATLTNNVACHESAETLPVFEIRTNASVYAQGDTTWYGSGNTSRQQSVDFSDVDLRLYGKLETPGAKITKIDGTICSRACVRIGTALKGRKTRFRLSAIGGTIYVPNYSWGYDAGYFHVACPEAGGRVTTDRPVVFKDVKFPIYPGGRSYNRTCMGVNNPEDEKIEVRAENTIFDVTDSSEISGGVELHFGKAATMKKLGSNYYRNCVSFTISGQAKVTFEDTGFMYERMRTDYTSSVNPSVDGLEALTFRRAWFMTSAVLTGNYKGIGTFEDAVWYVGDRQPYDSGKTPPTYPAEGPVFVGLREARLPEGSTFHITGTNYNWNHKSYGAIQWDRQIDIAQRTVITGGGNLFVSNLAPTNTMTATMLSGSNTCTGVASAVPGTRSTLRFADGANWAGTVVANGCVALGAAGTNVPAHVSFGALQITGELPVRKWATENDRVDIKTAITGRGRIAVTSMDGETLTFGDSFVLGQCPSTAEITERLRGNWQLEKRATSNPNVCEIVCTYAPHGGVLIVR